MHPGFGKMDVPRLISAGTTGVATGLLGSSVPIIGLVGGLIVQLVEQEHQGLRKVEYITEGVVDGSIALIGRNLFLGR